MLEIPMLMSRLLPDRFASGSVSVVRVETTRPLFLVFATDGARPVCVVQLGSRFEVERLHGAMTTLHGRLQDLVPESLACAHIHGETYAHIQSGLAGTSWFRIRERLRTPGAWLRLAERGTIALRRLHAAIQESAEWRGRVRPGAALRLQRQACEDWLPLSSHATALIDTCAHSLNELGEIGWCWQHGDFCVNNLLLTSDTLGIIDFEEFGETAMPLHDQFSLALSLHDFAPARGHRSDVAAIVAACIQPTLVWHSWLAPHVIGLFLHHLLWRINQCRSRPARATLCRDLIELLEAVAAAPATFLPTTTELRI